VPVLEKLGQGLHIQPACGRAKRLAGVMRNTIAVMNTKGGVGKSTLVLAMAETLSARFAKNVLIIDSDAQASVSLMLLSAGNLHRLQLEGMTIVDMLVSTVLKDEPADWPRFVIAGVSDVEEARSIFLIPSDMQLTLFEREATRAQLLGKLRTCVGDLLSHVRSMFDIVFVDCPPGLSVLTESWLREVDFLISPIKPDHTSTYALEVLGHFKRLNPELGFADNLGVLINLKEMTSPEDAEHHRLLTQNPANHCFTQVVPRTSALQHAGHFATTERSYGTKYPGDSANSMQAVCRELLDRLAVANTSKT
jgi:chromosome partitioning protein